MRRRAKVDERHPEIVKALREAGYNVLSLARVGGGAPDLLVGKGHRLVLMEVKKPAGPRGGDSKTGQKLNLAQEAFRIQWAPVVVVVRSIDEAITSASFYL